MRGARILGALHQFLHIVVLYEISITRKICYLSVSYIPGPFLLEYRCSREMYALLNGL
jgi:hypothetical protein